MSYNTTLFFITQFLYQYLRWNWQVPLVRHPAKDIFRSNSLKRKKDLSLLLNFPMPAAVERYLYRKKKTLNKYIKQQLPLFMFPWHVTWFFQSSMKSGPLFPSKSQSKLLSRVSISVCLQAIPSFPIRQTSGMGTTAQLPHGVSVRDKGQAVDCENSSEDTEVSVG